MAHKATPSTRPCKQYLHSTPLLPSEAKDILHGEPAEVVDIALSALRDAGIELIEWGALLQRRMSVPVFINVYFPTFLTYFPVAHLVVSLWSELFISCSRRRSGRCINYSIRYRTADNPSHEALLEYRRRFSSQGAFPQDNSLSSSDFCSTSNTISTVLFDPLALGVGRKTTLPYHSLQVSLNSSSSTTCSICIHSADDASLSSFLWHNGRTPVRSLRAYWV
jgi:hypothetical protein